MPNSRPSSTTNKQNALPLVLAGVFLIVSAVASLCLGAAGLPLSKLWSALMGGPDESAAARILWYARMPRTAACILAGAGLSVSGAVIQKVLNNSLASPGIIGVNAGAGQAGRAEAERRHGACEEEEPRKHERQRALFICRRGWPRARHMRSPSGCSA